METIEFEVREDIGIVTLNRPKALNALNRELVSELESVLREQWDVGLRALILRGSGDKAFAAGADITQMAEYTAVEAESFARQGQRSLKLLELALRYVANGDHEGRGLLLGRFNRTQLGFEPVGLAAAHDGPFENLRPPRVLRGRGKRSGNDRFIGIAEEHRQM